ncbi:MAG: MltA domain protein [Hyphomicrobiales bacterium]|nr:MltA domain protein [Hyphomicrobiales bacterium]
MVGTLSSSADAILMEKARLTAVSFGDLPGFHADNHSESWKVFRSSCAAIVSGQPELRQGRAPSNHHFVLARESVQAPEALDADDARTFYEKKFIPHLIEPLGSAEGTPSEPAFFTAYYRPEVPASLIRTSAFREPILARPTDLVTLPSFGDPSLPAGLTSARRTADDGFAPYPTRAEIDRGALGSSSKPIAFVEDAIEAFMIQVQGSARLRLQDGRAIDLTYAGRNGHPYASIGKMLLADNEIEPSEMSLDRLKNWVRRNGQELGNRGRNLLHRNPSFVFFSASTADETGPGPIGASGLPLTPLRSIAVDRHIWSYGLPFWIEAKLPGRNGVDFALDRTMVAQDTGSAIIGPARADLYFGSGTIAGQLAGGIRRAGRMFVFLPREDDA